MAALAGEAEMLEACRDLAWWPGNDDSWHIEWRDGPYASEVAGLLTERVAEPDRPDVLAEAAGPATRAMAGVRLMDVGFALRAIDPCGMNRLRARAGLWRLSAALEGAAGGAAGGTAARGSARRHWEELLGG
ncbi:hypothetical protein JOL79_03350 [Microbispora sp. RL4-1S]|uniref:Uncharacterized protein n=2 Tax=Microbispora oryzae TaxID=2806554 RepID=A0A941ANL8_9ACTN|nr:hypothetical protein [Microbispora oryzae]